MYPTATTPEFTISPCAVYNDNLFLSTVPLQNSLPAPLSPYSSGSNSSLSPGLYSTSPSDSPISPITPTSPFSSDNEDFSMDQLNEIKKKLNVIPPPLTAGEYIAKNPFEDQDGHIKRPSNNFILFRKIAHDQKNQTQSLSHYNEREWSQIIGKIWKSLSISEKDSYKKLGDEVANLHKTLFPSYKYQPKRDKAAWKHYTYSEASGKPKNKGKKVKQQQRQEKQEKQLEIMTEFQPQQPQQQLIPQNTLGDYSLTSETSMSTTGIPATFSFDYSITTDSMYGDFEDYGLWNNINSIDNI